MAKKQTLFAIDPQGVKHTRTTARTYTHTVVVLRGAKYLEAQRPNEAAIKAQNDRMWDRIENEVKGVFGPGEQWRGQAVLDRWQEHAKQWVREHSREADLVQAIERAHKSYADRVARGDDLKYENVGWCGRYDLADKLASAQSGQGYERVVVLEAQAG